MAFRQINESLIKTNSEEYESSDSNNSDSEQVGEDFGSKETIREQTTSNTDNTKEDTTEKSAETFEFCEYPRLDLYVDSDFILHQGARHSKVILNIKVILEVLLLICTGKKQK